MFFSKKSKMATPGLFLFDPMFVKKLLVIVPLELKWPKTPQKKISPV